MTDANQTPAEPGTPPAIIGALFDFAEAECGHNRFAAQHALTTVEAWVANAKAEIAKLRAALKACEVSMDTAALAGVGDILPPTYRDSWARAHTAARRLLAGKGEG